MTERIIIWFLSFICVILIGWVAHIIATSKKALRDNEKLLLEVKKSSEEALKEARAKTEFMANMSHDIRTPMNAISFAAELLSKEEMSKDGKNLISIIKNSSENLTDIANEILDFSKMDAGKMSLIEEEYKIKNVLDDVKNIIYGRISDKPIFFTINIDPTLPKSLVGDEVRIKQILINLLGNAVKYTKEGEISLSVTYERLSKDSIDVSFSVKDTGCGISPTEKEKLENRLSNTEVFKKKYEEGTGLGLIICAQLTTMMGGKVSFESELSKGSVFTATVRQRVLENSSESIVLPDEKFSLDCLVFLNDFYSKDSLIKILSSLSINSKGITTMSDCDGILASVKIDYVFTEENHFLEVAASVNRLSPATAIVLVANTGEPLKIAYDGTFAIMLRPFDIFSVLDIIKYGEARSEVEIDRDSKFLAPKASILVVDDNRVNLKVESALMETFKSKVTAVDSGFEAVELIKSGEKFDLIFMDHMMPGMDGIESAHRIFEAEGEIKTPIVALTANTGGEVEKLFFEAGMCDFLSKPIVMKHLAYVLQKWLPKDKQEFVQAEINPIKAKERNKFAKVFEPNVGLLKVWDDEKIYFAILHLFLEKSKEIVLVLSEASGIDSKVNYLSSLKNLCISAGAVSLPDMIEEALNISKFNDEKLFNEKLEKIVKETEKLTEEITDYLSKEEQEDVLTFE